ncbi:uncharacterized protein [Halyomorpha halys]|uniref:uncharacterized protein n=1 Tax=Halyomorpha halys TaxID=286706 RepID=UPI0006D50073|nr:uncharacterized protein LOC106687626 [Halyomorpha halys]
MDKANQAIRRSSVKLKCLNSGHSDLNMIISDIGKMRSAFKSFHLAQATTWEDMAKWATKEKNVALQETFHILVDVFYLWSEVQLEFIAGLKKFKLQFERILESELLLDKSKGYLSSCEQKDHKIRKELKKATSKGNIDDAKQLTERQVETLALVKSAQTEVNSKALENEQVKLMLVKGGLLNVSSSYLDMVGKANILFHAHKEVSQCLPDVHDRNIEEIRYSGSETARNIVDKAKEAILCYKKSSNIESAPPPPYSRIPNFPTHSVLGSIPEYSGDSTSHLTPYPNVLQNQEVNEYSSRRHSDFPPQYDLPPSDTNSLEGAVGGVNITDQDVSYRRYSNI